MEDKYYTPTIDEFHVGFEYELYDDHACEGMSDYYEGEVRTWSKEVFYRLLHPNHKGNGGHVAWKMDNLLSSIEKGDIRVKYLDREDIESLGFDLRSEDEFYSKDNKYNIYTGNKNIEIYSEGVCFIGRIKNKSELKRILKQIKDEEVLYT